MGKNERQAYLKAIRLRYRRARKKIKVTILDEFCSVCGYSKQKSRHPCLQALKAMGLTFVPNTQ